PDLDAPALQVAAGVAALPVVNRGAPGSATLVVGHGPGLVVGAPPGWAVDASEGGVTRLSGVLGGPGEVALALPVAGPAGAHELTVRLEARSLLHEAHLRAVPGEGDTVDATG